MHRLYRNIFQPYMLLICLLAYSAGTALAQEKFTLRWGSETALIAGGTAALGLGYFLVNRIEPLQADAVLAMNRTAVNLYDREATYNFSQRLADISDIALVGVAAAPLFLLTGKNMRSDWLEIGTMYSETALLTTALVTISKGVFKRNRPFVYNPAAPRELKLEKDARQSFFSGHTAITFAAASFFSTVYEKYYPSSAVRPYISGAVFGAAALTGYLRYQSGKHYQTDIFTGAVIGTVIGYLIPAMHASKAEQEEVPFTLLPGASFISLSIAL